MLQLVLEQQLCLCLCLAMPPKEVSTCRCRSSNWSPLATPYVMQPRFFPHLGCSIFIFIFRPVCLAYKPYFFSQRILFFSHNKSANSTFSHGLSTKRTGHLSIGGPSPSRRLAWNRLLYTWKKRSESSCAERPAVRLVMANPCICARCRVLTACVRWL